jgi:hypothetical protein
VAPPRRIRSSAVPDFSSMPTLPAVRERDTQEEDSDSDEGDNDSNNNDHNNDHSNNSDHDSNNGSQDSSSNNGNEESSSSDSDSENNPDNDGNSKDGNREQQGPSPNQTSHHHYVDEHIRARNRKHETARNRDEKANKFCGESDGLVTTFDINPSTPYTTRKANISTKPSLGKALASTGSDIDKDFTSGMYFYIIYV